MNTTSLVDHDERTIAVENLSYRWAYHAISFALLVDVAYRGFVRNEAAWDLLALVIAGGAISTLYQARQQALAPRWARTGALVALLGAIVAAVAATVAVWMRG